MINPKDVVISSSPAAYPESLRGGPSAPPPESGTLTKKITFNRLQHLLELVCKVGNAAYGGIGLLSADGFIIEYFTCGVSESVASELWRSAWSGDLIRLILQRSESLTLTDVTREPGLAGMPALLPSSGPLLGLPILCTSRCRGALFLVRSHGKETFGRQDEEIVSAFRPFLEQGTMFEEARLFAQLRLLNQVAQAAAGSLDLPRILSVALRELERYLPLHICSVWLTEAIESSVAEGDAINKDGSLPSQATASLVLVDTGALLIERALEFGLVKGRRVRLEETPFSVCLASGEAQYTDLAHIEEQTNPLMATLAENGANASFAVPLRAGDRTVGVLHSVCLRPTGFTSEQIQFLYLVADLLGPAISNCQLFSRLKSAYEELRYTQNQLIQSEKMRALGELASGMAHDFNNSLCGVLGFLELALTDKHLSSTACGYLGSARTCALDAAQTVRRVQDFARWQRNEIVVQQLDLNDLVRQTVELTRPRWENLPHARGNSITAEVQLEATTPVAASAAELREVLTNMVFNAVDAMPQGGRLTIRTWNTATDVFLSVKDTGIGMSESIRQRLFEPFFTTKGERGNGLGLSVAFGIVKRYSGEISVDSEVGQGSTFCVRFPTTSPESDGKPTPDDVTFPKARGADSDAPTGELPLAALAPSRSLRILVIEDEESIRRFLAMGLTQLGHRPRVTADAREGLSAFAEEHFDLVLTDLGLPGVSGEEVARTVVRRSPDTPVVLITGWSNQLDEDAQPLEGVRQVLGKPVTLNNLAATLEAVCGA